MGKLEGFNERRSEGSMFSTTFFNKIKEKVSALKENFLENEDLRPSQTLDAGVQGLKAGIQAIEEADRDGLIGDHLTEEQKYALNQIAIQGDNVEPTVDEQGKLTLSVDGNPMTIDEINELGVKAIAPEKEKTAIRKLAMSVREAGKQGEDFRRDEVFGSVKALVDKGDIDALLKNDITGTGTTPLEDISKNHPEFANLSYANLGIDPTGVDLNGDGIINENELALLSSNDREKIIKADPNILADYVTRKVAQSHMGGKKYFDEQNPKEDKPKMSADELIEKYSVMEDVAKDVGVTPDAAVDNLRDETRSALPFTDEGVSTKRQPVADSLRTAQAKINVIEIEEPINKKYNKLRDDAYQLYYNDEISEEEYDDKVKELNKEHRKEMYMSSPNIDAQIRPQREQMMQDDGKLYKEGKLSKEDLKRLYPRFWQDIIRIQDNK